MDWQAACIGEADSHIQFWTYNLREETAQHIHAYMEEKLTL
jgi:hypothetical protein